MVILGVWSLDATLTEQFFQVIEHATQGLFHQVNPGTQSVEVAFRTACTEPKSNAAISNGLRTAFGIPGFQLVHRFQNFCEALVNFLQAVFDVVKHSWIGFSTDRLLKVVCLLSNHAEVLSQALRDRSVPEVVPDIAISSNGRPLKRPGVVIKLNKFAVGLSGIGCNTCHQSDYGQPSDCVQGEFLHVCSPCFVVS